MRGIASKRASGLLVGDLIVTRIPGHAAFVDRVCDVRFVIDGKVHVDLNHWTAVAIYDDGQSVDIIDARRPKA